MWFEPEWSDTTQCGIINTQEMQKKSYKWSNMPKSMVMWPPLSITKLTSPTFAIGANKSSFWPKCQPKNEEPDQVLHGIPRKRTDSRLGLLTMEIVVSD